NDRRAGESAFQRGLFVIETQASHRLLRAMALVAVSREDRLDLSFEVNPLSRPCPRGAPFLRRRAGNRRSHSVYKDREEDDTDRAFEDSTHTPPAGMLIIAVSISGYDNKRALLKPTFAAKIVQGSGRCKSGSVQCAAPTRR